MVVRILFIALGVLLAVDTFAAQERPNIIWLSAEDISPHLGSYGDPNAITPTLDAMAARGVRYSHAFTVAPVCAPNRSAVITGMYPMSIGTHHMRSGGEGTERSIKPKLPPEIQTLPEILRRSGYYATNASKEDYNFDHDGTMWDDSSKKGHWKNRPSNDTPFFSVFNYTDTHEGSVRSTPKAFAQKTERLTDAQRQNLDDIVVPPYHADTPVIRRQWANLHELITGLDYWVADHLAALDDAEVADDTIVMFWSDHGTGLPRHKRWVYDSGIHVPLIVYVPEKWQEKLGIEPGMVVNNLVSSIDLAPTVLNLLGIDIPDTMQGQPFLGDDLPTPRDYVFGGRDRMDERYDMIRFVRSGRYKLIVNYMPEKPYLQYTNTAEKSPVQIELNRLAQKGTLPKGAAWVTRKTKPRMELYDLENDPHELDNLFTDDSNYVIATSENSDIAYKMLGEHLDWLCSIGDLGFIPEAELNRLAEKYGYRSRIYTELDADVPAFFLQLHGLIPFSHGPALSTYKEQPKELKEMMLSTRNQIANNMERLDAPSAWYWGIQSLAMYGESHPLMIKALDHKSGLVRIAGAQALINDPMYQKHAQSILIQELQSDDEWERLWAATALDEIGELARPALPVLKKALEDTHNKYVVRVANHAANVLEGTSNKVR